MPTKPPVFRPAHAPAPKQRAQQADRERGSASARGYDRRWQAFRAWFVARHPLCSDCDQGGIITPTEEVHHIRKLKDAPEQRLVEANCLALCASCHSKRTQRGE